MQFIDLATQQARIKDKIDARIQAVLVHGAYIMGPEVKELEKGLAAFSGVKYAFGCANGTDALQLAVMALGLKAGDAVFCPTFTFAATAEVVPIFGATPVFVDVEEASFNMDPASLERAIAEAKRQGLRPAGIIPVDLFGLPAEYDAIEAIAERDKLWIVADSAQGYGAIYKGRRTGSIGTIATTSFFPAKPLGCYGDGGAVFTNDDDLARLLDSLRVHGRGSDKYDNARIGLNSRLDTLQAAILMEKLAIYQDEIDRRQAVAKRYQAGLSDSITTPAVPAGCLSVWAQYTLKAKDGRQRDRLMGALKDAEIPSMVYYPRPLHSQTAYAGFLADPAGLPIAESLAGRVFSLPMHPYLPEADQDQVIAVITKELRQ
jgi:dTDP-4-amino-4,6-dideoxygalactose transaminase